METVSLQKPVWIVSSAYGIDGMAHDQPRLWANNHGIPLPVERIASVGDALLGASWIRSGAGAPVVMHQQSGGSCCEILIAASVRSR
jgi:hypothetical protein